MTKKPLAIYVRSLAMPGLIPGLIPGLVFGLVLCVLAHPGWAQDGPTGDLTVASDLGARLAMKVLLSSEDALSAGRFEFGDSRVVDTQIETQQIGVRWRLGEHRSRPFVGVFAGLWADEDSFTGPTLRFESEFESLTVGIEAGADLLLGDATRRAGWFLEPRAALGYSWAEQDDELEIFDFAPMSTRFTAEAEAWTALASAGVGRRWERPDRWRTEAMLSLWWLHTEPGSVDEPFADRSHTSEHLRLQLSAIFPLSARLAGHPLELATGLVHTELDDDVGQFFRSDRLTEASVALLARVGDEHLPVGAVGLAVRYFDAEAFDGWTLGITVSD